MANNGNKITAPVSIEDVRAVLVESSHDLGTLCRSEKINPFSRFKPVKLAQLSTVNQYNSDDAWWNVGACGTNAEVAAGTKTYVAWWRGTDGNCGLIPYSLGSASELTSSALASAYDGKMNGWVYEPPTGGTTSPYRLTDFVGYDHAAVPPLSNFVGTDKVTSAQTASYDMTRQTLDDDTTTNLNITEMAIGDYYFGIVMFNGSSSNIVTSTSKVSEIEGNMSVIFKASGLTTGTWKVYPILCTSAITWQGTIPSGCTCYSVPMASAISLTVSSSSSEGTEDTSLNIGLTWGSATSGTITFTATISGGSTSHKIASAYVKSKHSYGDDLTTEYTTHISSWEGTTMTKDQSLSYTGTVSYDTSVGASAYRIELYCVVDNVTYSAIAFNDSTIDEGTIS